MGLGTLLGIGKSHTRERFFWHTDIHSHICPGIDDGSPNVERSVRLVEGMADMGITRMIVTPHVTDEVFPNTPDILAESYMQLVDAVEQAGIDMKFNYSAEYRIDDLFFHFLENDMLRPLPGNYILVENSWLQERLDLSSVMFDLQNEHGLRPILAHPERYTYYHHDRERYEKLHASGVMFQVNLLSLSGYYGRDCRQVAEWLLQKDMVDFVGSDLHRSAHLEAIHGYLNSKDFARLEAKAHLIKNDTAFPD